RFTATITVSASTLSGNIGEGVYIQGASGTQLLGNTITGNSKSGVLVSGDLIDAATNHLIGSPLDGNTIASNGGARRRRRRRPHSAARPSTAPPGRRSTWATTA